MFYYRQNYFKCFRAIYFSYVTLTCLEGGLFYEKMSVCVENFFSYHRKEIGYVYLRKTRLCFGYYMLIISSLYNTI